MDKTKWFFVFGFVSPLILPKFLTVVVFFILLFCRYRTYAFVFLFASVYLMGFDAIVLPKSLPKGVLHKKITIKGQLTDIPSRNNFYWQFIFKTTAIEGKPFKTNIKLKDYNLSRNYQLGVNYQLDVKLKPFKNYHNEASKDYVRLMRAKNIILQGYVKAWRSHQKGQLSPLIQLRVYLLKRLSMLQTDANTRALMVSLGLGYRHLISPKLKKILLQTGTAHLLAISGLHVGLIAGFIYFLIYHLYRFSYWACLRVPAMKVASSMSLIVSFLYALLVGFSLPTQRALIMLSFVLLAKIFNQRANHWHGFIMSMCCVLMIWPLSIFLPGFYLSFYVVFVLLYYFQEKKKRSFIQLQVLICFLMSPLSLYFFSYWSLTSIPANLVAIPVVSFFILPLTLSVILLTCLWGALTHYLIHPLQFFITGLIKYLSILSTINSLSMTAVIVSWQQAVIYCVLALLMVVLKKYYRFVPIFLLLIYSHIKPSVHLEKKEALITVLDVGQGLSVVIQTKHHVVLYDTGARYISGANLGKMVIVPFLKHHRISTIDKLIISHEDIDHRGGLESVLKYQHVKHLVRSWGGKRQNCQYLDDWQYDGVNFSFLKKRHFKNSDNNNSCVLKVSNGRQSVLLPGDIEKKAERALIKRYSSQLKADVLLVPHHGSKSSSTAAFIQSVKPRYAVFSAALHNRYHFPHELVVARYRAFHVNAFHIGRCGQFQWLMRYGRLRVKPTCFFKATALKKHR